MEIKGGIKEKTIYFQRVKQLAIALPVVLLDSGYFTEYLGLCPT